MPEHGLAFTRDAQRRIRLVLHLTIVPQGPDGILDSSKRQTDGLGNLAHS